MRNKPFFPISLFLLLIGCGNNNHPSKKINFFEKSPIKQHDSLTQAYYDGKYFSPYLIRLGKPGVRAFVNVDSLYLKTGPLDTSNREGYYQKVIALLPKEEIEVFHILWNLPELKQLQTADGGYRTIVTRIKDRPDNINKYYEVEVLRNDVEQLTPLNDLTYFRVHLHPVKIEIATQSEYFVSLEKWRKVIR